MAKKNAVSAKAVKWLRKIERHILEEPLRFFMRELMQKGSPGAVYHLDGIQHPMPACGTAACIAGWACVLGKTPTVDRRDAEALLGITSAQGDKLFFIGSWPDRYYRQWTNTTDLMKRARIGKNRIEHFIKTGE